MGGRKMKIIKVKIKRPITNPDDMKEEGCAWIGEYE